MVTKPSKQRRGAMVIRCVLKISGLNTWGSSLPPPIMETYPKTTKSVPAINSIKFCLEKYEFTKQI